MLAAEEEIVRMIPTLTQRSVETSPVTASASFGISQNDVAHILMMLS